MTELYRATETGDEAVHPWSCWTEDRQVAEAYTEEGVGHGGSTVISIDADLDNLLDISGGRGFIELAEALGFDDPEQVARRWFDNGWLYPWEESGAVRKRLAESGYDWLRYDDDYPEGAVTVMRITDMVPNSRASKNDFDAVQTRGVIAGVYRGRRAELESLRTHLVYMRHGVDVGVGCRQPLHHIADEHSAESDEELQARPTCATCARAWERQRKLTRNAPQHQVISSQRYLDEDIVAEKQAARDYEVLLSPEFHYYGKDYQVVLDGHHSLVAAFRDGADPEYIEATRRNSDNIALLEQGRIEEFLDAVYNDSDWYNVETGTLVF